MIRASTPAPAVAEAPTERAPEAWLRFLRAHARLRRELDSDLTTMHGLTISDYDVLLALAQATDRRLRRVDLAERVLLTPSGITRLLDGLEHVGLVERASCPSDGRVVYAQLTDAGLAKLRDASRTHIADVRARFGDVFSEDELETLSALLGRLPGAVADGDCTVG